MNIRIYARTFFENKIGTAEEERLLDECRIISINDASIHPEPPPFSRRFLVRGIINPLGVSQAFWRPFGANATAHSDYVRKQLRQTVPKGRENAMDLRYTTREHPNLLVLFFDDVETEGATAFTIEMARQIVRFVQETGNHPILIHCTAGISRSGAVGLAIAEQCGCKEQFLQDNHDIQPNKLVLDMLRKEFTP